MCALVTVVQRWALPIFGDVRRPGVEPGIGFGKRDPKVASARPGFVGEPMRFLVGDGSVKRDLGRFPEPGQRVVLDHFLARGEHELERRRSEEHTSELQSLMRISYAVYCLTKKTSKV